MQLRDSLVVLHQMEHDFLSWLSSVLSLNRTNLFVALGGIPQIIVLNMHAGIEARLIVEIAYDSHTFTHSLVTCSFPKLTNGRHFIQVLYGHCP